MGQKREEQIQVIRKKSKRNRIVGLTIDFECDTEEEELYI